MLFVLLILFIASILISYPAASGLGNLCYAGGKGLGRRFAPTACRWRETGNRLFSKSHPSHSSLSATRISISRGLGKVFDGPALLYHPVNS
jgi:hypothetical protein